MSNQYFENNPSLDSNIKELTYFYKGKIIKLFTDLGVFSKSGIDFGSNLLLKTVSINSSVSKILDVGCGYGTLGISIAVINNNITVDMIDINDRAIALTSKAIIENNLNNAFVKHSNIYENVCDFYDLIITNPPIRAGKKIVHEILLDGINHLNDNGELWCVIQKKQGAESAIKALKTIYKNVDIITKDKGYYIIKSIK